MVFVQPPKNMNAPWSVIFHMTYARFFTRWPIIVGVPMTFKYFLEPTVEAWWRNNNAGFNQLDVWKGLEKRTKERIAADGAADE